LLSIHTPLRGTERHPSLDRQLAFIKATWTWRSSIGFCGTPTMVGSVDIHLYTSVELVGLWRKKICSHRERNPAN